MIDPFDDSASPVGQPMSYVEGDRFVWRRPWSFQSSTLKYLLRSVEHRKEEIVIEGERSGSHFVFVLDPDATAGLRTGWVDWKEVAFRTSDGARRTISAGALRYFKTDEDRRNHAEIMLDQIECLLENRARSDVESYSIGSRSITKMSVQELLEWRDYYRNEVRNTGDAVTGKKKKSGTVKVGFK